MNCIQIWSSDWRFLHQSVTLHTTAWGLFTYVSHKAAACSLALWVIFAMWQLFLSEQYMDIVEKPHKSKVSLKATHCKEMFRNRSPNLPNMALVKSQLLSALICVWKEEEKWWRGCCHPGNTWKDSYMKDYREKSLKSNTQCVKQSISWIYNWGLYIYIYFCFLFSVYFVYFQLILPHWYLLSTSWINLWSVKTLLSADPYIHTVTHRRTLSLSKNHSWMIHNFYYEMSLRVQCLNPRAVILIIVHCFHKSLCTHLSRHSQNKKINKKTKTKDTYSIQHGTWTWKN